MYIYIRFSKQRMRSSSSTFTKRFFSTSVPNLHLLYHFNDDSLKGVKRESPANPFGMVTDIIYVYICILLICIICI